MPLLLLESSPEPSDSDIINVSDSELTELRELESEAERAEACRLAHELDKEQAAIIMDKESNNGSLYKLILYGLFSGCTNY
jgi:hypothetical protein